MELKNQIETVLKEMNDCVFALNMYNKAIESDMTTEAKKLTILNKMIEITAEFQELEEVLENRLQTYIEIETKEGDVIDLRYRQILMKLKKPIRSI